jgi:serine phosphatase RsbU (regulator of sigma subunit)
MANTDHGNTDLVTFMDTEGMDEHLSSLRYAGIIQNALMPDSTFLKNIFNDFFVLFLPRDIVSGDFYYVNTGRQLTYIAAGDCTGHGVPGALLSIMGISFLNDILQCRVEHKANRVLNQMRERVMKALHQTGDSSVTKDSIDIGLCIYDRVTRTLQYSGANRPLIIVREGEVLEMKSDKMTIGLAPLVEQPFTNHIIEVTPGDSFYLFSDGYADQFGGTNDKKFKQKQLKNLIGSVSRLSMQEQKEILEKNFLNWKGDYQQVDDVMIFGFKF